MLSALRDHRPQSRSQTGAPISPGGAFFVWVGKDWRSKRTHRIFFGTFSRLRHLYPMRMLQLLLATLLGGAACAWLMLTKYVDTAHVIALTLIAAGSFMDSQSTNLTRPEQMYLSQMMIAFGAAMFLPPVMAKGFGAAIARGTPYLVNFITIFLFTQITGSMLMTGLLGSFVTLREKFHSNILVENILLTNPAVAQRVSQLSGAYSHVITDPALLKAKGLSLLGQQVSREAYVLAYNDTFLLIAVVSALALAFLLIHLAWRRIWPLLSGNADAAPATQS